MMIKIERKCKGEERTGISSVKRVCYFIASMSIYVIHIGISIVVEYIDVRINMVLLMIILVGVFMVGFCISIMLLKQSIPPTKYGKEKEKPDVFVQDHDNPCFEDLPPVYTEQVKY